MIPSDISRTESVSSQLSGKVDDVSVSSGDVSEPTPVKEDSESVSNHLNNNVTVDQTPNGVAPVDTPVPTVPDISEPTAPEKIISQEPSKENDIKVGETVQPVEPSGKSNAAPAETSPSESASPSENGIEVVSVSSSTGNTSEETDQLSDLPSASTPPTSVSINARENADHLVVNACTSSVSDQLTEKSTGIMSVRPENSEPKQSNDSVTEKLVDAEQKSSKADANNEPELATSASVDKGRSKRATKGTSFSSLNKIPPELAAALKPVKEASTIPEEKLPEDEASVLNMLDEVLSSDLANESAKVTNQVEVPTAQETITQPSVRPGSLEEVFGEGDINAKLSNQVSVARNNNTAEMNGSAHRLRANGTQVFISTFALLSKFELFSCFVV